MTTIVPHNYGGRLGNQLIRNLAVSMIAEKFDLKVFYSSPDLMKQLGIPLFSGSQTYTSTKVVTDKNYFTIYHSYQIDYNLDPNDAFFQNKKIIRLFYQYLQNQKYSIIEKNPYQERYISNKDIFIHIRLCDVAHYTPGLNYYVKTIQRLSYDTIYVSTDERQHELITQLSAMFPIQIFDENEIKTIQFASTCKYLILSHGSFSAVIGYLSFFSEVYFPEHTSGKIWYGDVCCIPSWKKMDL